VQHQRDECETAAAILTRLYELADLLGHLGRGAVPDQACRALKNLAITHAVDLGGYLLDSPTKTSSQTLDVENNVGIPVEVDEDVPREQRVHVRFHELYDRGSQDPLKVVQPSSQSLTSDHVRIRETRLNRAVDSGVNMQS
jgi:hypothetical protein